MYSLTQIFLVDGEARWMHIAGFGLILLTMGFLMEREIPTARILAVPLLLVAARLLMLEPRWFRIFPALVIVFALLLNLGYVALN